MKKSRLSYLSRTDILLRIVADLVMINGCLLIAFALRFLGDSFFDGNNILAWQLFTQKIAQFALSFFILSFISLASFTLLGVYTRARGFSSRLKVINIVQAVTLSYLVFTLFDYLVHWNTFFPRSLLIMGWVVTISALLFSRLWSVLWKHMTIQAIGQNTLSLCGSEKNILVIGGAGYIGSALLPKLLTAGYRVRLLDLFVYGQEPIQPYLDHPRLEIIKADFRQIDEVVKAVKGVGAVIHLGAIVGDPACALNEELTIEINLMATRMIAEICKGFGVRRFIFASTCSVYGASEATLDENSALNPVSLYAKTKIACEQVLQKMADATFSPVILRFSTIFGLSGRTRFDLVVNLLTAKAYFENEITIMGGDQWRPFLHVDDAASSILYALKSPLPKVHNEIFNVGSDQLNYTIGQIGEMIQTYQPAATLVDCGFDGDKRNYRVSFEKICHRLGYTTTWTLEQGIQQVLQAIAEGKVVNYKASKFSNVLFLQETALNMNITTRYFYDMRELVTQ